MKETLTGRQRILKTLAGEPVDRVPMDLGVHFSTGISVFAYHNLRKYLGLSTDSIEMIDMVQMLARVDKDIRQRFHLDTVLLNPKWPNPHRWNIKDEYEFIIPGSAQPEYHEDGRWTIQIGNDLQTLLPGGYFMEGGWPDFYAMDPDEKLKLFAAEARKLREEEDLFTMYMGFNGFFDGLEFACDMITDPDECIALNEKRLKDQIAAFDKVNKAMGPYIDSIEVNSDLGTQNNLMCRPEDYEEICAPYLKEFCRHVHETSDIKVFMHSCGSIIKALPMIVDCGVDIINPVQISASDMDPKVLKEQFGGKINFWGGGCNTQQILNNGSPEDVKKNVKELMDVFKPGGHFVFNQVHNIMGDIKPENIVAMFDTAYENSFYNE
jgi:uroporphyrinogen decarboxylase